MLARIFTVLLIATGVMGGPDTASAQGAPPTDTTGVTPSGTGIRLNLPTSPFDTIDASEYAAPRSFSLDNFMESLSALLIGRTGPIGAQAAFSRYGFGAGRGFVYLGRVPINDPQDGQVPLALTPTTAIGEMITRGARPFPTTSNIEGAIHIIEPPQLAKEPVAVIDLSKGDHDLKQRRASFASPRKSAGIYIGYDELRNAGYAFDARGLVDGSNYGSSATRSLDGELRGTLPSGESYRFSLRRFRTTFQGDTLDAFSDNRRDGFIALANVRAGRVEAVMYGRNYKVSTRDSVTMNETAAVNVTVPISRSAGRTFAMTAGYENIFSKQDIADGFSSNRLQNISLLLAGNTRVGDTWIDMAADAAHQFNHAWGWGARLAATRQLGGANRLTAEVQRGFRLPNLSELFLPFHRSGSSTTTDVVGNASLKSEASLEGALQVLTHAGVLRNELRALAIRVRNPILPTGVVSSPTPLVMSSNTEAQGLQIIEDRVRLAGMGAGFEFFADAGAVVALGDRERYFQGVPSVRAVIAASIGRSLFKDTSHILFGADYVYSGSRTAGGAELEPYGVVNLKLEGRLVDAHLYLLWMNVSREEYETVWPYLMTPRTFVYGVSWTFFN